LRDAIRGNKGKRLREAGRLIVAKGAALFLLADLPDGYLLSQKLPYTRPAEAFSNRYGISGRH
jgi:hypothetical protein